MPSPKQPERCPIRFLVWSPDGDSALDYDWFPVPKPPKKSKRAHHFPNRVRAHRQGLQIAREELSFMRARLTALGAVIAEEQALVQFQKDFDTLQGRVRKLLRIIL